MRAAVRVAAAAAAAAAPAAAAPCVSDYAPGTHFIEVQDDGMWDPVTGGHRQWILHVPPQRATPGPAPLVLVYHGATANPYFMDKWLGLSEQVNKTGWVVIAPFGIAPNTNRTGPAQCCDPECDAACCESGRNLSLQLPYQCGFESEPGLKYGNDIAFTRYMVKWAAEHACADVGNVFATAHSNGAMFVNRLACEASDLVKGIAPVSGNLLWPNCSATYRRAIPYLEFCGTADYMCDIPFDKGGAVGNAQAWAGRNGCDMSVAPTVRPLTETTNCTTYADCTAETTLCRVENFTHQWPGHASPDDRKPSPPRPATDPDATQVIFSHFADLVQGPAPSPIDPPTPRPAGAPTPIPVVTPAPASYDCDKDAHQCSVAAGGAYSSKNACLLVC